MLECGAQEAGSLRVACGHQGRRVLPFSKADGKAVVAQGAQEGGQLRRDKARDLVHLIERRRWSAAAHATLPRRRAVTSRVMRDLSSWVFSRHIMVSNTASGASWRLPTSSPTSAAAQSSVSATPGTLRNSSLRTLSTMRATCSDRRSEER